MPPRYRYVTSYLLYQDRRPCNDTAAALLRDPSVLIEGKRSHAIPLRYRRTPYALPGRAPAALSSPSIWPASPGPSVRPAFMSPRYKLALSHHASPRPFVKTRAIPTSRPMTTSCSSTTPSPHSPPRTPPPCSARRPLWQPHSPDEMHLRHLGGADT